MNDKIAKASKLLFKIRNTCGKLWGQAPEMMHQAYTTMVRPIVTYGAMFTANHLKKNILKKLQQLQRQAHMMMGNFRKGTPGDSLDILMGTTPIDLHMKEEALLATARMHGKFDTPSIVKPGNVRKGHIETLTKEYRDLHLTDISMADTMEKHIIWNKDFKVNTHSYKTGKDITTGLWCYTYGRKMYGKTGLGFSK